MTSSASSPGPTNTMPASRHARGEAGVLREESVARVHGLGARLEGRGDDAGRIEVALGGGRCADAHGLVGEADVRGIGVGVGVHRDRVDAEAAQGADDPHRDLAAVGDEHPREGSLGQTALPVVREGSGVLMSVTIPPLCRSRAIQLARTNWNHVSGG